MNISNSNINPYNTNDAHSSVEWAFTFDMLCTTCQQPNCMCSEVFLYCFIDVTGWVCESEINLTKWLSVGHLKKQEENVLQEKKISRERWRKIKRETAESNRQGYVREKGKGRGKEKLMRYKSKGGWRELSCSSRREPYSSLSVGISDHLLTLTAWRHGRGFRPGQSSDDRLYSKHVLTQILAVDKFHTPLLVSNVIKLYKLRTLLHLPCRNCNRNRTAIPHQEHFFFFT